MRKRKKSVTTRRMRKKVRKRMVMRMKKQKVPQANGQLRTTRMTTSIPRSRKPTKTIREPSDLKRIYTHAIFFNFKKEKNEFFLKRPARPTSPLKKFPLRRSVITSPSPLVSPPSCCGHLSTSRAGKKKIIIIQGKASLAAAISPNSVQNLKGEE